LNTACWTRYAGAIDNYQE